MFNFNATMSSDGKLHLDGYCTVLKLVSVIQNATRIPGISQYLKWIGLTPQPDTSDKMIQVVKVAKRFKNWFLQVLSGSPSEKACKLAELPYRKVKIKGFREDYVCLPSDVPRLSGWLIAHCCIRKRSDYLIKRALQLLNVYTCIRGSTSDQIHSAITELSSYQAVSKYEVEYLRYIDAALHNLCLPLYDKRYQISDIGLTTTVKRVAYLPNQNVDWDEWIMLPRVRVSSIGNSIYAGNLAVIDQEPGNKVRIVGVSTPENLLTHQGLQRYLQDILFKIPTDCTYNQDDGRLFAQRHSALGHRMYSVDSKDWTYHFPSSLQRYALTKLNVSKDLIDSVLDCWWGGPSGDVDLNSYIFPKGQMMGLMPSFLLAALVHNLILLGICKVHGFNADTFRVLGDDVIIVDSNLYQRYMKFQKDWSIPISALKTFISPTLCEFAGRIFYCGIDLTPMKVKIPFRENNLLRWANYIGIKCLCKILNKKMRIRFLSLLMVDQVGSIGCLRCYSTLARVGIKFSDVENEFVGIMLSICKRRFNDKPTSTFEWITKNYQYANNEDQYLQGMNLNGASKAYRNLWKWICGEYHGAQYTVKLDEDQIPLRERVKLLRSNLPSGKLGIDHSIAMDIAHDMGIQGISFPTIDLNPDMKISWRRLPSWRSTGENSHIEGYVFNILINLTLTKLTIWRSYYERASKEAYESIALSKARASGRKRETNYRTDCSIFGYVKAKPGEIRVCKDSDKIWDEAQNDWECSYPTMCGPYDALCQWLSKTDEEQNKGESAFSNRFKQYYGSDS